MLRPLGLTLLILAVPSSAALAETPDLKLGLWETTTTSDRQGMPMPDPSQMPPEMRARMETYLKTHPQNAQNTHVMRSCLTKEKLDKELFNPGNGPQGGCTRTVLKSTKTTQDVQVSCPNGVHGEGHYQILSPMAGKGTFTMSGAGGPDGKTPFHMSTQMTTKWISADCGDVK
jgi:Protein of unknown function (DUF3617)